MISLDLKEQPDHVAQGENITQTDITMLYLSGKKVNIYPRQILPGEIRIHREGEDGVSFYSLCISAGVYACRTPFTLFSRCPGNRADALATIAFPPATAETAVLRHARLRAAAAVAVFPRPAGFTVTLSAVTHSMTYKHEILQETGSPTKKKKEIRDKQQLSHAITHLRRVLLGSEHKSNCHTRSTSRRSGHSWMDDTHTGRSSSPPDHYISQSHWSRGSYSKNQSRHCIHTALPETPADTHTRHSGKSPGLLCTGGLL